MRDYGSVPFRASDYDYKVRLGVVMDAKSISWSLTVHCDEWRDVDQLVTMWEHERDNPAVEVEVDYLPDRVTPAPEADDE